MTIGQSNLICAVCKEPKHHLRRRKSRLIPDLPLLVCDSCHIGKKEPRWAIIMVARRKEIESNALVREYVTNHRYVGDPILLDDIL